MDSSGESYAFTALRWAAAIALAGVVGTAAPVAAAGSVVLDPAFVNSYRQSITGICFHQGSLYAVTKGNVLLRFDPATGALLEVVDPMLPDVDPVHIHSITPGADGTFWVGEVRSSRLFQLRFSDYAVVDTIPPPGVPAFGLGYREGILWVGYHTNGEVRPIDAMDPETGLIVDSFDIGSRDVHGLAWVENHLWVLDNTVNALFRVNEAGQVVQSFALPFNTWGSLAFDGSRLWTTDLRGFYRINLPTDGPAPPPGPVLEIASVEPAAGD